MSIYFVSTLSLPSKCRKTEFCDLRVTSYFQYEISLKYWLVQQSVQEITGNALVQTNYCMQHVLQSCLRIFLNVFEHLYDSGYMSNYLAIPTEASLDKDKSLCTLCNTFDKPSNVLYDPFHNNVFCHQFIIESKFLCRMLNLYKYKKKMLINW